MGGMCGCCADDKEKQPNTMRADHMNGGLELYGLDEEKPSIMSKFSLFCRSSTINLFFY